MDIDGAAAGAAEAAADDGAVTAAGANESDRDFSHACVNTEEVECLVHDLPEEEREEAEAVDGEEVGVGASEVALD